MPKFPKNAAAWLLMAATFLGAQTAFAQIPRIADAVLGGTVTAVTADQATIKTIANEPFTIVFAPSTTFFKQRGNSFSMVPAGVTDVHVGGSINVMGHLDPDGVTKHATNVMILTAETSRKLLANIGGGITEVTGKVTAIRGHRLTIKAYDGTSQVIEVSASARVVSGDPAAAVQQAMSPVGSALRAGIEAIKFTDLKRRDSLYAEGAPKFPPTVALKDNIIVASSLAVMTYGSGGAGATSKP
jgi:hypothetical protein